MTVTVRLTPRHTCAMQIWLLLLLLFFWWR